MLSLSWPRSHSYNNPKWHTENCYWNTELEVSILSSVRSLACWKLLAPVLHSDDMLSFLCSQVEGTFPTPWKSPQHDFSVGESPLGFLLSETVPSVAVVLTEFSKESIETTVLKLLVCEEIMWPEVITLVHETFSKQSSAY